MATPIDASSVFQAAKVISNRVIPKIEELRKLKAEGYGYVGVGFFRVRARWEVDRDGKLKVGGGLEVKADLAELAKIAAAGGVPAADIAAKVSAAFDRVTATDGAGVFELMLLPLVVPESQMDATAQMIHAVFGTLAGREEEK